MHEKFESEIISIFVNKAEETTLCIVLKSGVVIFKYLETYETVQTLELKQELTQVIADS